MQAPYFLMQAPYYLTLPASTRESTNREDAPQPESATARSLSAAPRTQPKRPENRPRTAKTPLRTLPGKPGNLCIQSDVLLERVTGIEPALSAWEAEVLPLNYTRVAPVDVRPRCVRKSNPDSGRLRKSACAGASRTASATPSPTTLANGFPDVFIGVMSA